MTLAAFLLDKTEKNIRLNIFSQQTRENIRHEIFFRVLFTSLAPHFVLSIRVCFFEFVSFGRGLVTRQCQRMKERKIEREREKIK